MKKLLAFTLFTVTTASFLVYKAFAQSISSPTNLPGIKTCDTSNIEAMLVSELVNVQKLSELNKRCVGNIDTLMLFTSMPKDKNDAAEIARGLSSQILEMNKYGLKPIVIIEPDSKWGLIDFREFNTGFWDAWINDFFVDMKEYGVTADMVALWVPFPEANLPLWNHTNTTPSDYSRAINKYLSILKDNYPTAKAGILLNSATYETDDFKWHDGKYISLLPYVENIEPGLVDSFGIQGFPWMPDAFDPGTPLLDPKKFINNALITEAANSLGVKQVWYNTGTFAAKYTQEEERRVFMPAEIRQQILNDILSEAGNLQDLGYEVTINIFAEDKSLAGEQTDWSYYNSDYTANPKHLEVFKEFLSKASEENISLSLFLR